MIMKALGARGANFEYCSFTFTQQIVDDCPVHRVICAAVSTTHNIAFFQHDVIPNRPSSDEACAMIVSAAANAFEASLV